VKLGIAELMDSSGVKFGTSGARGLVTALTDRVAYAYTLAFIQHLEQSGSLAQSSAVAIAGDLRPSTGRILNAIAEAIRDRGHQVLHAGRVPSPALVYFAMARGVPSIMVTGSHIPDDRNGIKFNTPFGEILKPDEEAMRRQTVELPNKFDASGWFTTPPAPLPEPLVEPARAYVARWLSAFPKAALQGRVVGVYGHSAVGRDLFVEILEGLGAEVVRFAWSDRFIPVDTEAIRVEDKELARGWAKERPLFALFSSDGDSDRPLVADEAGIFFRGDVAGVLTARFFSAGFVAVPVSCNTALERSGWFSTARTRIGSPFVIEAMQRAVLDGRERVVGYEANGGFLQATVLRVPGGGELSALPTRDPVIVGLSLIVAAAASNRTLSQLHEDLPRRVTASDRLQEFPSERALSKLRELSAGLPESVVRDFPELGPLQDVNETDGLRLTFDSGEILHLRASGNAPEFRCYVEADSDERADALLAYCMSRLATFR